MIYLIVPGILAVIVGWLISSIHIKNNEIRRLKIKISELKK